MLVNVLVHKLDGHVHIIEEIARRVIPNKNYNRADANSCDPERFSLQRDIWLHKLR